MARNNVSKTRADIRHRADHIREWFVLNQFQVFPDYKLAKRVGCDRKIISFFRNGKSSTGIDIVEAMLNELGFTLTVQPIIKGERWRAKLEVLGDGIYKRPTNEK